MKSFFFLVLVSFALAVATSVATAETERLASFADDREAIAWTYYWGNGGGAQAVPPSQSGSAALRFVIAEKGGNVTMNYGGKTLPAGTRRVKFRLLHPANHSASVDLRVLDSSGESFLYPLAPPATASERGDWISYDIDISKPLRFWSGNKDGRIDFPATLALQVSSPAAAEGAVRIGPIDIECDISDENRWVFAPAPSRSTGNILFAATSGAEAPAFAFTLEDRLGDEGGEFRLEQHGTAPDGSALVFDPPVRALTLPKGRPLRFTVSPAGRKAYPFGLYRIAVVLRRASDDASVANIETTGAKVLSRPARAKADGPFGMNISLSSRSLADAPSFAGFAAAAGVNWTREEISWERIEPVPGQFLWENTDAGIRAARAAGLQVLGLIGYSAAWARRDPGKYTSPPRSVDEYAEFVYKVVSRYHDSVKTWEIWNEPDSPVFWPPKPNATEYAALLSASYAAAKRADPDCKVVTAGLLVGMNHVDQWGYFEELCAADARFDLLGWHAYCDPRSPEAGLYARRTRHMAELLAARRGPDMRLWLTEQGWPTVAPTHRQVSEEVQAAYMVRAHLLALSDPSVATYFWFLLRDGANRASDYEQSYGILHPDSTPKRAFPAYVAMTHLLNGASFPLVHPELPQEARDAGVQAVAAAASAEHGRVTALWLPEEGRSFEFASGNARVFDIDGNEITRPDGTVTVGALPVYVLSP